MRIEGEGDHSLHSLVWPRHSALCELCMSDSQYDVADLIYQLPGLSAPVKRGLTLVEKRSDMKVDRRTIPP